jgi:ankyrin repeat protein
VRVNVRVLGLVAAVALSGAAAAPLAAQAVSDSVAFIKAVREGDGGKASALLSRPGSTVSSARDSGSGENALHIAVRRRDTPWVNFMAQSGVDTAVADRSGDTPLGLAARLGYTEGARVLIARGAKIDGANARGETPLIIAVQNKHLDMVRMLVANGANPDKADSSAGYSARDYARQDRRNAAILRLLEAKRTPAARPALPAPAKASAKPQ